MRLHLCRVGGCRKRAPTEFGFHFEPLLKRKDELALFRNLTLGSTDWRATLPAAGATSSEFGIVLHPVAPGYIRRQGGQRASVGGIWLSFSALVENNGSDWVRFVIWFWVRRGRTQADEHRHSLRTNMPGQSRWRAGCPSLP